MIFVWFVYFGLLKYFWWFCLVVGDSVKFLLIYFLGVGFVISRDGFSGGVVCLVVINKDGVERFVLIGN